MQNIDCFPLLLVEATLHGTCARSVGEKSRGVKNSRETRSIDLLAFDEKHVCTKVLRSNPTRFDGDKTEWNSIRPVADSGSEKK